MPPCTPPTHGPSPGQCQTQRSSPFIGRSSSSCKLSLGRRFAFSNQSVGLVTATETQPKLQTRTSYGPIPDVLCGTGNTRRKLTFPSVSVKIVPENTWCFEESVLFWSGYTGQLGSFWHDAFFVAGRSFCPSRKLLSCVLWFLLVPSWKIVLTSWHEPAWSGQPMQLAHIHSKFCIFGVCQISPLQCANANSIFSLRHRHFPQPVVFLISEKNWGVFPVFLFSFFLFFLKNMTCREFQQPLYTLSHSLTLSLSLSLLFLYCRKNLLKTCHESYLHWCSSLLTQKATVCCLGLAAMISRTTVQRELLLKVLWSGRLESKRVHLKIIQKFTQTSDHISCHGGIEVKGNRKTWFDCLLNACYHGHQDCVHFSLRFVLILAPSWAHTLAGGLSLRKVWRFHKMVTGAHMTRKCISNVIILHG